MLVAAAGLLLAACSSTESGGSSSVPGSESSSVPGSERPPPTCSEPPPDQLAADSPLDMTLDPNPVQAGELATVIVAAPPSPATPIMGVGLDWLCWDGSAWTMTHKLFTDDVPTGPQTLAYPPPPGVTTTIIGLPVSLPSASGILIPDVPPGTYRLQTGRPVGETAVPFVLVEVVS